MGKDPFKYVHVWIGHFDGTSRDFDSCFDLTPFYASKDGESFERCAFSSYLGREAYSEDIFSRWFSRKGLEFLINELNLPPTSQRKIEVRCKDLGLTTANAAIVYGVVHLEDASGLANGFRGLTYLGEFKEYG